MPDADNADKSKDSDADTTKTVALTQYQELQRKYDAQNKRLRLMTQQALDNADVASAVKRQEEVSKGILEILAKSTAEDDSSVKSLSERLNKHKEFDDTASAIRRQIDVLLADKDTDWTDERLSEARSRWKADDFAGAYESARKALDETPKDISDLVAAKVQEALKSAGKVDTREAPAPSSKRYTRADLLSIDPRKPVKDLKEDVTKMLDQFFKR